MTRTLFIADEKTKSGQVEFVNHGVLVTATIEDGKLHVVATWEPHEFSDWCAKFIDCKADIPKK